MAQHANKKYASKTSEGPVKPKRREHGSQLRLSRSDWLAAARLALVAGGIDAVKVDRLAKRLNVTRGGFYWHFKDRDDLLNSLLAHWEHEANFLFESVIGSDEGSGEDELRALTDAWIAEDIFSPAYDSAVRDWARTSNKAEIAVRRVDARRLEIIQTIYEHLGFPVKEAMIRARILYFHQVGYYTLGLGETTEERRDLLPLYLAALTDGKVR